MRLARHRVLSLGAGLWLAASCLCGEARALVILGRPTVTTGGDPFYIYDFNVYLSPDKTLNPVTGLINAGTSDYLTIYDINGLQPYFTAYKDSTLTSVLNGYGATDQNTGITPSSLTLPFTDDPTLPNVTIRVLAGHPAVTNTGTTNLLLGTFEIQSFLPVGVPPTLTLNYSWQDNLPNGGTESGFGTVTALPEPATLGPLVAGLGVLGAWWAARRRGRRTKTS
jgi:hypothetical protein